MLCNSVCRSNRQMLLYELKVWFKQIFLQRMRSMHLGNLRWEITLKAPLRALHIAVRLALTITTSSSDLLCDAVACAATPVSCFFKVWSLPAELLIVQVCCFCKSNTLLYVDHFQKPDCYLSKCWSAGKTSIDYDITG